MKFKENTKRGGERERAEPVCCQWQRRPSTLSPQSQMPNGNKEEEKNELEREKKMYRKRM